MAGKTRVKLSGDRKNRTWLTENVTNSPFVDSALKDNVTDLKRKAELKMKRRYPKFQGWHYGTRRLAGKWGATYLMWPVSPMSRATKNKDVTTGSIKSSRFKTTSSIIAKRKVK